MRFTVSSVSALMALVSTVLAEAVADFDAVFAPTQGQQITAGSTFLIKWQKPTNPAYFGTVTINHIGGQTQNTQQARGLVAAGIDNQAGEYTWSVPADLGGMDAFSGLTFTLDSDPTVMQYSNYFQIVAGSGEQVSVAPTASASASASAPASSAPSQTTAATGSQTSIHFSSSTSAAAPASSAPAKQQTSTSAAQQTTSAAYSSSSSSTTLVTSTRAASSTVAPPPASTSSTSSEAPAAPTETGSGNDSGAVPIKTMTSTAWTAPTSPPVPTTAATGVPTSGATRAGSSLAVVGGLLAAVLVL